MLSDLLKKIDANGGFLTETEIHALAELDRLRLVLVRCNNGRFMCPAQDVEWFSDLIESTGKEWVRDVALPTADPAYRGDYTTSTTMEHHKPENSVCRNLDPQPRPAARPSCRFNEADCGGAFDGFNVTSDADPGL